MQSSDEKLIQNFQTANEQKIKIIEITDKSPFSQKMSDFTEKLITLAPRIERKRESVGYGESPGLYLGTGLRCHFIPTGQKLESFIKALTYLDPSETSTLQVQYNNFKKIELPADIKLYIAEGCPHCPKTFAQLLPLPFVNSQIRLSVVDPTFFPELAENDSVRSVPTTLLDREFRWTGSINLEELYRMINTRDPSNLSTDSLDMMLKEGQAMHLVEMFKKNGIIYPAFIELLTHPTWSTRLGAMVVMEALIESDFKLATQIQDPIWQQFESVIDPVKGDLLYIIGELKSKDNVPKIKQIINGEYSGEVKEAAQEALVKMSDI